MKPVCLITGAGGLLGNALCDALSKEYQVVATYKKSIPRHSSQLIKKLSPGGEDEIFCIQGDLTKKEDIRRIVDVALARFGQIDVIINNAVDYSVRGKLLELYQAEDYATPKLFMNSVVPFQLVSYVHACCWKDSPGENQAWNRNVINISSIAGVKVYSSSEAFYSASKSALNMLTLHLALELSTYSVRVNAICPAGFSGAEATAYMAAKVKQIIQGSGSGSIVSNLCK